MSIKAFYSGLFTSGKLAHEQKPEADVSHSNMIGKTIQKTDGFGTGKIRNSIVHQFTLSTPVHPLEEPFLQRLEPCCIPVQTSISLQEIQASLGEKSFSDRKWSVYALGVGAVLRTWMDASIQWFDFSGSGAEMVPDFQIEEYLFYMFDRFEQYKLFSSSIKSEESDRGDDHALLVIAFIYLKRLTSGDDIGITRANVVQLTALALNLAMKTQCDQIIGHKNFAELAGYDPDTFADMERSFLKVIGFNMEVRPAEYARVASELKNKSQSPQPSPVSQHSPFIAVAAEKTDKVCECKIAKGPLESTSSIRTPYVISRHSLLKNRMILDI